MSVGRLKSYRFATAAQWESCVLWRFDVRRAGGVGATARLGTQPHQVTRNQDVTMVAANAHVVLWRVQEADGRTWLFRSDGSTTSCPFEMDPLLAVSPRWLVQRQDLWAFSHDSVRRYPLEQLQGDLSVVSEGAIIDIADDGHDGVWLLERIGEAHALTRVNCKGTKIATTHLPGELGEIVQLVGTRGGRQLLLLTQGGERLTVLASGDLTVLRNLSIADLSPQPRADQLVSDGADRLALWSTNGSPPYHLSILDGDGDRVDELALQANPPVPAFQMPVRFVALADNALSLATQDGLWRLDSGDESRAREADSVLLTPQLLSPEVGTERGWLRAELDLDLPVGTLLEVQPAGTGDAAIAAKVSSIAVDPNLSAEHKQARMWELLNVRESQRIAITGPTLRAVPVAIPLFESADRFLWLRVRLVTPSGVTPPALNELRVLYPNLSITDQLPAVFRGERNDPTGFMRRLAGVLETTTQSVDLKIRQIAKVLDTQRTTAEWLDYLARWLDLPWDDGLPEDTKRRLLESSGPLLSMRGTRSGLLLLLSSLFGADAVLRVTDPLVDSAPARLGGNGRPGLSYPVMLAGSAPHVAKLNTHVVLGRARLSSDPADCSVVAHLIATVCIDIAATPEQKRLLSPLLPSLLAQYLPGDVRSVVRVRAVSPQLAALGRVDELLDGKGVGALDETSVLGRTALAGRRNNTIDDGELDQGYRLQ